MRLHLLSAATLCILMSSPLALASGGGGFDQSGFSQKRIDQQYEAGKSFYKSRQADSEFVASLYSCADPNLKIAEAVPDDQGDAILYYLNKRFKLRLSNG